MMRTQVKQEQFYCTIAWQALARPMLGLHNSQQQNLIERQQQTLLPALRGAAWRRLWLGAAAGGLRQAACGRRFAWCGQRAGGKEEGGRALCGQEDDRGGAKSGHGRQEGG